MPGRAQRISRPSSWCSPRAPPRFVTAIRSTHPGQACPPPPAPPPAAALACLAPMLAYLAGLRRHEDDGARAPLLHARHHQPGGVDAAQVVDAHHVLELLQRQRVERRRHRGARAVDQHLTASSPTAGSGPISILNADVITERVSVSRWTSRRARPHQRAARPTSTGCPLSSITGVRAASTCLYPSFKSTAAHSTF